VIVCPACRLGRRPMLNDTSSEFRQHPSQFDQMMQSFRFR
jgi:hypothetical protein